MATKPTRIDWLRTKLTQLQNRSWLLRILVSLVIGYVLLVVSVRFYRAIPYLEGLFAKISSEWDTIFYAWILIAFIAFSVGMLVIWSPDKRMLFKNWMIRWRERMGWLRWPIIFMIALFPTYLHLYTLLGNVLTGPYPRLLSLAVSGLLIGILMTKSESRLLERSNVIFSLLLVGCVFYLGQHFSRVTDFPFSLSWSEGNRMYDYSLYFAKENYTSAEEIKLVWAGHGRNLLWGILFVFRDAPIWMHRLWDAILWTIPYLLLGILLARRSELSGLAKWSFAFWVVLFLAQGPIYTPLIISAIIVVVMVRPKNLILSLIGAGIAGYYAAISRWTWMPAPTAWTAILLVSNFEFQKNEKWRDAFIRLVPIGIVIAAGLVGGMLADSSILSPSQVVGSEVMSHNLLWLRLLPNATYAPGILLGLAISAGPLVALMFWLYLSKRWKLNWLQVLVYGGAFLVFLSIGVVASVKIGGGSNLHNLDMFLINMVILTGVMLRSVGNLFQMRLPQWINGLLILIILLPVWNTFSKGSPLSLPPNAEISEAMFKIKKNVKDAATQGEVLFLDQRQLLTFRYLKNVPLVQEYEKKYVMNEAMASNHAYFNQFYQDLENKRFSMIVSEILFPWGKGGEKDFGVENDVWAKWVAEPILCYYEQSNKIRSVNVQLLVPRQGPVDCPEFPDLDIQTTDQ